MEQLWEIFGRGALDNQLVQTLHLRCLDGPEAFTNFVNGRIASGGLGYRMARAEMADLYNLTSHATVVSRGVQFSSRLKQALREAGVPETDYSRQADLAEFRTFLGMIFIDNQIHMPVSTAGAAQIQAIAAEHNFALGEKPCEALYRFFKDGTAIHEIHALHDKWTPPDCYSALTFSDIFEESTLGGVRRADGVREFGKPPSASYQSV
jgi:hypothetical protein